MTSPSVVFVPRLRDHVADHWQTLLEARLPGSQCVFATDYPQAVCDDDEGSVHANRSPTMPAASVSPSFGSMARNAPVRGLVP